MEILSQVWQEDTEATISSLASNSAKVPFNIILLLYLQLTFKVSESLSESHQLQKLSLIHI